MLLNLIKPKFGTSRQGWCYLYFGEQGIFYFGGGAIAGSRIIRSVLAWRSRYLFPGAAVFNRTLPTLHDGYLTRTETPAFRLLLVREFGRDFFFIKLRFFYPFVSRRYDAAPTEKGEFSRCNLAVEANVSAPPSVAYLMKCWLCFCTNRLRVILCVSPRCTSSFVVLRGLFLLLFYIAVSKVYWDGPLMLHGSFPK